MVIKSFDKVIIINLATENGKLNYVSITNGRSV
jgi:hypothetical protein